MTGGLPDLNALPLPDLYRELTRDGVARRLLELARDEDLGSRGDVTTASCFPRETKVRATLVARQRGVIAGLAALEEMRSIFAPSVAYKVRGSDGQWAERDSVLAGFSGPAREVLALERTMLNLLSRLSGIATAAAMYTNAMRRGAPACSAAVYDTRKTTPGLRNLSKYAVRCGGGMCHRVGLFDAVLIKDNHLAHVSANELGAFVARAAEAARRGGPVRFVEVEVTSLAQLDAILSLPHGVVDIVLLDNMSLNDMRQAVERRDKTEARLELEASGGVTLDSIGAIAATGVERISVGALTHSAPALDLALDFV